MTDKQPTLAETAALQVAEDREEAKEQVRVLGQILAAPDKDFVDSTLRTATLARDALIKELMK